MNWKNIIENLILIVVMFVGLGVYTSLVLKPILIESIQQETTKIVNEFDTKIDNKFKKIEKLSASLPTTIPVTSTQSVGGQGCGEESVCIAKKNLTNKQRKRLGI